MECPVGLTLEFETAPLGKLEALIGVAKIASAQAPQRDDLWRYGLKFSEVKEAVVKQYMASMLRST